MSYLQMQFHIFSSDTYKQMKFFWEMQPLPPSLPHMHAHASLPSFCPHAFLTFLVILPHEIIIYLQKSELFSHMNI